MLAPRGVSVIAAASPRDRGLLSPRSFEPRPPQMALLHEKGFAPPPPIVQPCTPVPDWTTADVVHSPRRGKDSLGVMRFAGRTPRRLHKLLAADQEFEPKECFSARDGGCKGTIFDMDVLKTQPQSISAREAATRKVRAIDLDLGLSSSESTRTVATRNAARDKERKDIVAKLRTQVHTKEQHFEDVQAEIETTARANAKVKASFEKLQTEHALLQARHIWAKSSLDSALSTQEEYKRHYESVEASLARAKSELAKQEELLQSGGAIERAKAELALRETKLECELMMVEQTKQLTVLKLKENSRAILECMTAARQSSMAHMAFQHWMHAVQQERAEAEKAEEAMATQHLLRQLKHERRQLAFVFAERLASAAHRSLASTSLRAWAHQAQEAAMMAPVSPLRAPPRGCDVSPRLAISSTMFGLGKADVWGPEDGALRQCQAKHGRKAASVLKRLADEEKAELVSQVFGCWSNEASKAKAERSREVEAQATLADLEAALQALGKTLQGKTKELEDANEELDDVCQKNRDVYSACKELKASVADTCNEIQAMVDEE